MTGKFLVTAVAVLGWLAASLVAFIVVALVDFLGIGLIGVFIAFASAQVELDSEQGAGGAYGAGMLGKQQEAERQMSPDQRAASRNQRSLAIQSARSSGISGSRWRSSALAASPTVTSEADQALGDCRTHRPFGGHRLPPHCRAHHKCFDTLRRWHGRKSDGCHTCPARNLSGR